jgi:hypothetical protein
MPTPLGREEYIEQLYFFRTLRERQATNLAAQEILENIHEEILASTQLPYAIQFLAMELKHSGLLSSGFARLPHYFTPFQAFVIQQAEKEGLRFNLQSGFLALEREAEYRAKEPTPPGLFFYQFEVISRNRLGYDEGLTAMAGDPLYDDNWRGFLELLRRQGGEFDFAEMVYLRSELYVDEQRRTQPDQELSAPGLFGEKEGKIAKAHRRRDPLFLFAALQRQLGYPDVPRTRPRDDLGAKFDALQAKLREWEARLKLLEAEVRGSVDLSQFGKPELLQGDDE